MDKFYIDRAFGVAIWIDVEKGIVQECYNESEKFVAKMNEKYVGKSITFLKEDFIDRAMAGTYHNLVPYPLASLRQEVQAWKSKVKNMYGALALRSKYNYADEEKEKEKQVAIKEIRERINEFEREQYKAEAKLELEEERIFNEHNFKS
jgi:hypothetical protein